MPDRSLYISELIQKQSKDQLAIEKRSLPGPWVRENPDLFLGKQASNPQTVDLKSTTKHSESNSSSPDNNVIKKFRLQDLKIDFIKLFSRQARINKNVLALARAI